MTDTPDSSLFPWEDEQPGDGADTSAPAPADETAATTDPYDPNCVPPIPAEIAPDEAAERVRQDEFDAPAPDDAERAAATEAQSGEAVGARRAEHARPLVRKEYYSISEVSELVGLPAHVLRYWESQFSVLNPSKNRSGNRVYQRKEIRLILLVKQLLYEDKYTVEGAKQRLDQLRRGGALPEATANALNEQLLSGLRDELRTLSELLAPDAR